jgi:hypothetical protein
MKLYHFPSICQLFSAVDLNSDPLIKSQVQSGPEPNIDKKLQVFSRPACFFFDNGRCMFCSGSGTKQAQPEDTRLKGSPSPCRRLLPILSQKTNPYTQYKNPENFITTVLRAPAHSSF